MKIDILERGQIVTALRDLDKEGAGVAAGELGVVFEKADAHADGCGPLVRWFSGGCCNVYEGDVSISRP